MEPLVEGDGSHVVPIDQWPTVIELPPESKQKPTAKANKKIVDTLKAYEAAQAEGDKYLREKAAITEGMTVPELNAWCVEMERWNDAVHGEPRHAVDYEEGQS